MKRGDFIILLTSMGLVGGLYKKYWFTSQQKPQIAIITTPFEQIKVKLNQEQYITIKGKLGETVIYCNKQGASFHSAPCHDKLCIQAGFLSTESASSFCIPNGVSLRLAVYKDLYDSIHY